MEIEPRLGKKLSGLFMELLSTNKPASIEIELIKTTLDHFNTPDHAAILKLAINKLIQYLQSSDPNRKYFNFLTFLSIHVIVKFLGLGMLS